MKEKYRLVIELNDKEYDRYIKSQTTTIRDNDFVRDYYRKNNIKYIVESGRQVAPKIKSEIDYKIRENLLDKVKDIFNSSSVVKECLDLANLHDYFCKSFERQYPGLDFGHGEVVRNPESLYIRINAYLDTDELPTQKYKHLRIDHNKKLINKLKDIKDIVILEAKNKGINLEGIIKGDETTLDWFDSQFRAEFAILVEGTTIE